jgi:hypothetical protein
VHEPPHPVRSRSRSLQFAAIRPMFPDKHPWQIASAGHASYSYLGAEVKGSQAVKVRRSSCSGSRPNKARASARTIHGTGSTTRISEPRRLISCSSVTASASSRANPHGSTGGESHRRPGLIHAGLRHLDQLCAPPRQLGALACRAGSDMSGVAARAGSPPRCRWLAHDQHTVSLPWTSASRHAADTCQSRARSRAAASSRSSAAR